jgi:hypothetical protein
MLHDFLFKVEASTATSAPNESVRVVQSFHTVPSIDLQHIGGGPSD